MKKSYLSLEKSELLKIKEELVIEYEKVKGEGFDLDMSRGKPGRSQLDLTMPMLDVINSSSDMLSEDGMDTRNYGGLTGIPEAKRLMADLAGVKPENTIVYGNSSLNIMYDCVSRSMVHGVCGSTPWMKLDEVKFLCPAPGYDRHFAVTETFGIKLITVPMTEEGPDMDMVEELVEKDSSIKGIWCVPKYANPTGISYSDETVRRLAALKPAAEDFRLYWDNAYGVHHLYNAEPVEILEILSECEKAGNPDMVYEFMSTSKISFPGAGVAALYTSENNIKDILKTMTFQTIGYDKINQLRHVRFFGNIDGLMEHMKKQAALLRPKFEAVISTLEEELGGLEICSWRNPVGGYFISFDAMEGTAKNIVAMMKDLGVVMTGAGATFPYGKDPKDSNIRISPSLPEPEEMKLASRIFTLCVKLAAIDKLLEA